MYHTASFVANMWEACVGDQLEANHIYIYIIQGHIKPYQIVWVDAMTNAHLVKPCSILGNPATYHRFGSVFFKKGPRFLASPCITCRRTRLV